ncbi:uncharacterized protein HaLaN_05442 [Haematococcus lacustris]|uniref:Uncharacterized protein n=1 Tax=Haematococcus lacustris TaxID=44745 RepID=A0A699YLH4_HAELA|nr:uncharacterized protein HaLaN_05442 [Haematococcus lacustris]
MVGGASFMSWAAEVQMRDMQVRALWDVLAATVRHAAPSEDVAGQLLAVRTEGEDWVQEGRRLPLTLEQELSQRVQHFKASLPPYPSQLFQARGVVIIAGGLKYMVRALWDVLAAIVRHAAPSEDVAGQLLAVRTEGEDWVQEGRRLPLTLELELTQRVQHFKASLPPYPSQLFQAKGVVIIAGGLKYMVSAWISLHMLRRTGCLLPVEVWFPLSELPTPELEDQLLLMGAVVRTFDMRDLDQSGFTLKPSALLLSSFQPGYRATGSLLWQDFWEPSAAPQVYSILGIPGSRRPPNSHESGQMLVDKTRHWQGLLLCVYLNYYHEVYYELLTGFMGKGDKVSGSCEACPPLKR